MLDASSVFEGASVLVDGASCGTFPDKINSTLIWLRLRCSSGGVAGSNIKFQLKGDQDRTLTICGIRVYGSNDAGGAEFPGTGIAIDVSSAGVPHVVGARGFIYKLDSGDNWTKIHPE